VIDVLFDVGCSVELIPNPVPDPAAAVFLATVIQPTIGSSSGGGAR
jgi:hypothetical protein